MAVDIRAKTIGAKRGVPDWQMEVDGKIQTFHDKKPRRAAFKTLRVLTYIAIIGGCAQLMLGCVAGRESNRSRQDLNCTYAQQYEPSRVGELCR